jgi:sulfhydrogenase subunit alpha
MPSRKGTRKVVRVDALSRVEGGGSLHLVVEGGRVVDLRLALFEPPRFFDALLRGRHAREAPDITARICGICPVAYQMSAVHALERLFGVAIDPAVRALRRLYYCGEWIQSHALHVFMLAAPDFFGCESVITLAQKERAAVERGLRLRKTGNAIIALLGGRSVHPLSACIGGFTRVPRPPELTGVRADLERAREDARAAVRWVAGFDLPDRDLDIEFVSLRQPGEYPMNDGRMMSSKGIDCTQDGFPDLIEEQQVPHSNALHATVKGRGPYLLGPLARVNLNFDELGPSVAAVARATHISWPSRNPFVSIVARTLEILYAVEEAIRIIDTYEEPAAPAATWAPRAGVGRAVTEAPRGSLYHSYETDEHGVIRSAHIVPPTAQNQAQIEADLRALVPAILPLSRAEATSRCETVIRNYDPCISCATHFLDLTVERR